MQWRDKASPFEDQVQTCMKLKALCDEFNTPMIVNDNPYLALESGADGVHLGQDDVSVWVARDLLGDERLIGLSTHTRKQALDGAKSGANYLGFGPMYQTRTKQQEYKALEVGGARWATGLIDLPLVAIGGITPERARRLARVGVRTVAVISALFEADDPGEEARDFIEAMDL